MASLVAGSGFAIGAYAIYWPSRMIKRIDLVSPSGSLIIPPRGSHSTRSAHTPGSHAPYSQCELRIVSLAADTFSRIFKPKTYAVSQFSLLGPLSGAPKRYHPKDSTAFNPKNKKAGKFPGSIPLKIAGRWDSFTLRRDDAYFEDLEGLEKALLANASGEGAKAGAKATKAS